MAARQGTPRKLAVIFSWRVATARHAFSLAPSRSTRLRLVQIQAEPATAASLLLGGIAGRVPKNSDLRAEIVGAVAAITDDPERHTRQLAQQPGRQGQLVRCARCYGEGDRPAAAVGHDAGFGAEAAARAAGRLAAVALLVRRPLMRAPAAVGCARITDPSSSARPSSTPRACSNRSKPCQVPSLDSG